MCSDPNRACRCLSDRMAPGPSLPPLTSPCVSQSRDPPVEIPTSIPPPFLFLLPLYLTFTWTTSERSSSRSTWTSPSAFEWAVCTPPRIKQTGCSPSFLSTDLFQSPVAPTLFFISLPLSTSLCLSLSLSLTLSVSLALPLSVFICLSPYHSPLPRAPALSSPRIPRSIHQLGSFRLRRAELSSIRCARTNHPRTYVEDFPQDDEERRGISSLGPSVPRT